MLRFNWTDYDVQSRLRLLVGPDNVRLGFLPVEHMKEFLDFVSVPWKQIYMTPRSSDASLRNRVNACVADWNESFGEEEEAYPRSWSWRGFAFLCEFSRDGEALLAFDLLVSHESHVHLAINDERIQKKELKALRDIFSIAKDVLRVVGGENGD